jgi:hypothetical protein
MFFGKEDSVEGVVALWQRKILDALFESSQRRIEAFKFLEAALDEHSTSKGVHYQTLML